MTKINCYLWNRFQPKIGLFSNNIIWLNYKKEYNDTFRDNPLILKDPKNFIPNDDTVYNIILETKEYEKIKKETEKFRNDLLRVWDENKKKSIETRSYKTNYRGTWKRKRKAQGNV